MTTTFADALPERGFQEIGEAISSLRRQRIVDTIVDTGDIQFPDWGTIAVKGEKEYPLTRSAFVQLLHFASLQWEDVADWEQGEVLKAVQTRLGAKPRQLLFRAKSKVVQAVLSPHYTPITNLDILTAASKALDMSKVSVTLFRGYLRLTGVTDRLSFQPAVGDTLSGGWEITNNEFGKDALSVNQFVLRLVCTNGAVVREKEQNRFFHRGWQREALIDQLSATGETILTRMEGLNGQLRRLTETRLDDTNLARLERTAAKALGKEGLDTFRSTLSANASLYDAYNHLTYVSQQKKLGPRRELEMIAGQLLMKQSED